MTEEVAVNEDTEFYPELLGVVINYLDEYEGSIINGSEDAFATFNSFTNRALFHIAKQSCFQFVLEDAGFYADEGQDIDIKAMFKDLQAILSDLYWEQICYCLPGSLSIDSAELASLKIENHPDLFNDHVATYSYLPNILLNNLLTEGFTATSGNSNSDTVTSLKFEGVCMLADISGFTKLSGACCAEGTSGLDRLHDATSGYLGKFVQTVYTYKGDGK